MYRALVILSMLCLFSVSALAADQGTVPTAANSIAKDLDLLVLRKLKSPAQRREVTIATTVPVFLGDLEQTSPLARQMAEEVTLCLVKAGYLVDELRQGKEIIMQPFKGEMILTRKTQQLAERQVAAMLILAGTYTITKDSVRFNLRLLNATTQEVVAMANATVPITEEIFPLLADKGNRNPLPSVFTRLP